MQSAANAPLLHERTYEIDQDSFPPEKLDHQMTKNSTTDRATKRPHAAIEVATTESTSPRQAPTRERAAKRRAKELIHEQAKAERGVV